jgi:hypothetical protein
MPRLSRCFALTVIAVLEFAGSAFAKKVDPADRRVPTAEWSNGAAHFALDPNTNQPYRVASSAVVNTLVLATYKFDSGATCTHQGWTSVDMTLETGDYWHVDDFAPTNALGSLAGPTTGAGVTFAPIQGTKSMWMGQRIPPAGPVDTIHCSYLALPGYGNQWDQSFCSKACLSPSGGPSPNLDIAFIMKLDVQPSYDGTEFEYTTDCAGNTGWTSVHVGPWFGSPAGISGAGTLRVANSIPVGPGPVKVRLHFSSDFAWSNQDGLYPGLGVVVDSMSWEGTPVEDFEGEAIGAHSSEDWESCNTPGFGNYLALFRRDAATDEDPCLDNISCYWAALQGSTEFYSCGTPPQPTQRVVPHMNARHEYISNEIWSPPILLSGTGTDFRLRYSVYRDLPLDNLVFHVWHVRSIPANGCPGPWLDRGMAYFGDSKDWYVADNAIGSKINLPTATSIQVALGVVDMCPFWCGVFGTGACHSPAPYFDNVQVLRLDMVGPLWDVRTIDTFQDTFSANGTITGTARADEAMDIKPSSSPTFTPGDSCVVLYLIDPQYTTGSTNTTTASGLSADPILSTYVGRHKTKKQAYLYVSVWPQGQANKTGAPLSEGPGGQANRYPFMGTQVIDGITWTKIRMDYTYTGTATNPGNGHPAPNAPGHVGSRFNVDLNDNLFTPGDTVCYFFGATSPGGTTYYSTEYGVTADISAVAANPMELTVLPAGGYNRGGDVLYVDGADGLINQTYFDGTFMNNVYGANFVDRYDVRAPSSGAGNRLGGRVVNVAAQLNACYKRIIWDCGPYSATLGDGSGDPEKCNDYALLNTFLGNLTSGGGGVFLCGDRVAEYLNGYAGASAVTFRSTYLPFTLINNNHRLAPTSIQVSPTIEPWPGRIFDDSFVAFGGCPELNDFDVMGSAGTSQVQMTYTTPSGPHGAVVSNIHGNARMIMAGFQFALIRDNELNGVMDRSLFLYRVLQWLGPNMPIIDPVGAPVLSNSLSQNYPNPFNPQTSIAFSLKQRSAVNLKIYDVAGALVRELVSDTRAAGAYNVKWDGRDGSGQQVASGVYFYKLVAGNFASTKKMVLLK